MNFMGACLQAPVGNVRNPLTENLLILRRILKAYAPIFVAGIALSIVFWPKQVKGDTKKTTLEDIGRTRTLIMDKMAYHSPDWNQVLTPQLARRDAQIAEAKRLEEEQRAKAEAEAKAAQAQKAEAEKQKQQTTAVSLPGGSHTDWMTAAGIDPANFGYVEFIVSRESGWNPNAINSSSGACGLGQQNPCGKWPGAWNDPIAALSAMNSYVARYGGWAGAYAYWQAHGNY